MLKRFLKRNSPRYFLSKSETQKLMDRVAIFEDKTGCELVFHFRRKLGPSPTEMNRKLFFKFNLDKTTGHRGILITLSLTDRQFSVWADEGVAVHAGDRFWTVLCEGLARDLKTGSHLQALLNSIATAEKMLEGMKPINHFDNELSNAPIVDDED
jgi:uncharacterized membrane protein